MQTPHTFVLPMDPERYKSLYNRLNPSHANPLNTGTETTSDVTLNWSYDGEKSLTINVTAAHSMKARLAPAGVIQEELAKLLNS